MDDGQNVHKTCAYISYCLSQPVFFVKYYYLPSRDAIEKCTYIRMPVLKQCIGHLLTLQHIYDAQHCNLQERAFTCNGRADTWSVLIYLHGNGIGSLWVISYIRRFSGIATIWTTELYMMEFFSSWIDLLQHKTFLMFRPYFNHYLLNMERDDALYSSHDFCCGL